MVKKIKILKVGTQVRTPHGDGKIRFTENYRGFKRYGVEIGTEVKYYLKDEISAV